MSTVVHATVYAFMIHLHHMLTFDDVHAIANAAVSGFGIAWLPSWLLAHHVKRGELVTVMDRCFAPDFDVHVVWPKTRYLPLALV